MRKFTADEARVTRGEWFLTRSFGIVQEDFLVPALGVTVDVWFEEAPGLESVTNYSCPVTGFSSGRLIGRLV